MHAKMLHATYRVPHTRLPTGLDPYQFERLPLISSVSTAELRLVPDREGATPTGFEPAPPEPKSSALTI